MKKANFRSNSVVVGFLLLGSIACDENQAEFQSTREKFPKQVSNIGKEDVKEETATDEKSVPKATPSVSKVVTNDTVVIEKTVAEPQNEKVTLESMEKVAEERPKESVEKSVVKEEEKIDLTAKNFQFVMEEDSVLTKDLNWLSHDLKVKFAVAENPTAGILVNEGDGKIEYRPFKDFFGQDTFTYEADVGGVKVSGKINIDVIPVNDDPFGENISIILKEDEIKKLTLVGGDVDNFDLIFSITNYPSHGVIESFNEKTGEISYRPNPDYFGTDHFNYEISDGSDYSPSYDVSLIIEGVNDLPKIIETHFEFLEDTVGNGQLLATDVDDEKLSFSVLEAPRNGILSIDSHTGSFQYTPQENYNGSDYFSYTVADPQGKSMSGKSDIMVSSVKDAIIIQNVMVDSVEDQAITKEIEFADPDGTGHLKIVIVANPIHGTLVTDNQAMSYTYVPNKDFSGTDFFQVQLEGNDTTSAVATFQVEVAEVNDPPVVSPLNIETKENTPVHGMITATDKDGNNLLFVVSEKPKFGIIDSFSETTGSFTYVPHDGYVGNDGFFASITDGEVSVTLQVGINIKNVNDAPIANDATYIISSNEIIYKAQLEAVDPDGDELTYAIGKKPNSGEILFFDSKKGIFSYQGSKSNEAQLIDTFTFVAADDSLSSEVKTITIKNNFVNEPPVVQNLDLITDMDVQIETKIDAADKDGDQLTYAIVEKPQHGMITAFNSATGHLTYLSHPDFSGTDSFSFSVSDGFATTYGGIADVTVRNPVKYLCAESPREKVKLTMNFPATNKCNWGKDGNLSRLNGFLRARTTQVKSVPLPENAVLCHVNLTSQSDDWRYDDFTVLTLNHRVLVSSNRDVVQDLDEKDGLKIWNWDHVKGDPIVNFIASQYCVGGTCKVPGHDRAGAVDLKLDQDTLLSLGRQFLGQSSLDLRLIATGDNEDNDCEHTGIAFDFYYEYVSKN